MTLINLFYSILFIFYSILFILHYDFDTSKDKESELLKNTNYFKIVLFNHEKKEIVDKIR